MMLKNKDIQTCEEKNSSYLISFITVKVQLVNPEFDDHVDFVNSDLMMVISLSFALVLTLFLSLPGYSLSNWHL